MNELYARVDEEQVVVEVDVFNEESARAANTELDGTQWIPYREVI